MKTEKTAKLAAVIICIFLFGACTLPNKSVKYEAFKSDKKCVEYEPGMQWQDIEDKFCEQEITPIPAGNSLDQNIRIYEEKFVIFHTELKKIKINEKTRYLEIVNKLEICVQE